MTIEQLQQKLTELCNAGFGDAVVHVCDAMGHEKPVRAGFDDGTGKNIHLRPHGTYFTIRSALDFDTSKEPPK